MRCCACGSTAGVETPVSRPHDGHTPHLVHPLPIGHSTDCTRVLPVNVQEILFLTFFSYGIGPVGVQHY